MNNCLRVFSFALIFLFSCNATKKAQTNIDPVLTIEPRILDLGAVTKGEDREMLFTFTNTGNQPVEIELATGCQCSEIIAPTGKEFAPGEQGTIKVIYHTVDEKDFGPQKKTVDLILVQTDAKTGYQLVKQFWYTVNLVPIGND